MAVILWADIVTKRWALEALSGGRQIQVIEGFLPFTLAFNRGAAFGLTIGSDPRWIFVPLTIVALIFLITLLVQADRRDHLRVYAASFVMAGAVGNLIDRVRWDRGVVDFIGPVNLIVYNFPIFNVADIAISCGAGALMLSFWLEGRALERQAAAEARAGEITDAG
jgi:signal peptidase II